MNFQSEIEKSAKAIEQADALLITAGAGMGVDSGLPDFRGNKGFWEAYPPIARLGKSFSEMANPRWFDQNPNLAWAFYGHRLNLYRNTLPHAGYKLMLEFAKKLSGGYFVFTSNVDGQFQKAGFDPECIEECHGSIHHFQCISPCSNHIWDASEEIVSVDEDVFLARDPLPVCPNCGAIARPNILMFGDWKWVSDRSEIQGQNMYDWLYQNSIEKNKIVILEFGAGTAVATVRYQSENIAARYDATLIRINPRDYHVPSGNISIPLGALEGVTEIWKLINGRK